MSYWYKVVNAKEYVVALNCTYDVTIQDNGQMLSESEDKAYDIIEETLKKNDIQEIDLYTKETRNGLTDHTIKVSVNMVVPAVASDYDEALSVAETYVDDITFPECVHGISIGTWDATLKEDKDMLMRCKGA